MSLGLNNNNNFHNYIGVQNVPQYMPVNYYTTHYGYPEERSDFFSDSDTQTAKDAGFVVVAGLLIREGLKRLSNHMFSSFFAKNNNIAPEELEKIGLNMLKDKKLMESPQLFYTDQGQKLYTGGKKDLKLIIEKAGQDAHFDFVNNHIKVTKDTLLSLPHEIGHAVQEHSTTFLKKLQRFRGNYTALAVLLYGLGRSKSTDAQGKESFLGKIQNALHKYSLLIPLLAFSPELITEFKASKIGIDYMQKAKVPEHIIKAAKKHYAVAFCTYLALPLFAIFDNLVLRKASQG